MPELAADDFISIDDDPAGDSSAPEQARWRVLIVDDDHEVHEATVFSLGKTVIEGRRLEFLHAASAAEALAILRQEDDIAVIMLDVVMEREDSGLELVRRVRDELARSDVRIVLRTGQPGYAPELQVIRDYDINDYKTKSELTLTRLTTTLATAIRSYRQLHDLAAGRRGLETMALSFAELFGQRDLRGLGRTVLQQAAALLGGSVSGLLVLADACRVDEDSSARAMRAPDGAEPAPTASGLRVLAALGDLDVDAQLSPPLLARLVACLTQARNIHGDCSTQLCLGGPGGVTGVVHLQTSRSLSEIERRLLDVFAINAAASVENARLVEALDRQAFADPLTRLPNRACFIAAIDQELAARAPLTGQHVALFDLDRFSEINDALGHRLGDLLLGEVARRLGATAPTALLARVGPDVFGLLGDAVALAPNVLLAVLAAPFVIEGFALSLRATLGCADLLLTDDGGRGALRAATIALNIAKRRNRGGFADYSRAMAAEREESLALLNDLRAAIRGEHDLQLFYQPQIELCSGRIIGVEALLRWRRHGGDFVRPDHFIPLAERSGLIVDLGAWVLDAALAQIYEWEARGISGLRMSINVSLAQFRSASFLPLVEERIRRLALPAGCVELEITESMAMLGADSLIETLGRLKALGLSIAIDDFGAGFSSLAYLQQLPVDRLKIDRAFVTALSQPTSGQPIARMIVDLGRALGLVVIAEGVETAEQEAQLITMQCAEAQGYLYARPLPAAEFERWLAARSLPAAAASAARQ
ncbi:EAL domain-containing protein [Rhodocyclus tenuis]|uniref:two-component system response regulator n=1 Tax=Rhodocyclus tenuis TaxID=1066 RepID=UPI001903C1BB|nr:EAL domain-containing protein [Rhodocyclus tenuis]MBK1680751.1 hypothetical protein [Rhodocyclus tenuis]